MENILPEWFDEKEFETFLNEGVLTRQAWMKGLDRWRATKVALSHLLGKTPMKHMSRLQKNKHAIMARTAIQNARDIQAAQNREEDMQAKRNYIRQEQVDVDFDNFIEEDFQATSSPVINFGGSSAGEVAREKNPTGNEKKFARLKKREQRRRKRLRGMNAESFDLFEEKRGKAPAKKQAKSNVGRGESDQQGKENRKEQSNTRETTPSGQTDKNDKSPTEEVSEGDFSDVLVVKTKGKIKIISKNSWGSIESPELIAGGEKGDIKNKSELEKYLGRDNFQATETSNTIFGRKDDTGEKEEKEKKKEEPEPAKPKAKPAASKPRRRQTPRQKPAAKGPGKITKFSVVGVSPEDENRPLNYVSYRTAERLAIFPELIELSQKGDDRLAEYLGEATIAEINQYLQQNPGAVGKGKALREAIFQQARMDPRFQNEDLIVLPFGEERVCSDTSDFYKQRGASDTTPKSDLIVVKKSDMNTFLKALGSKDCIAAMSKLAENSYRISVKKGKAVLGSSQATETLAVIDSVQETLKTFFQGKMDPEIKKQLDLLVQETLKLKGLGKGGVFRTAGSNTITSIRKAIAANGGAPVEQGQVGYEEQQFVFQSTQIMEQMNKIIDELFRNKIVKSAVAWEIASGANKFGTNSMSSAQGLICLDRTGQYTGNIPMFQSFEEAMNSKAFGLFVDSMSINVSTKSAKSKGQDIRNISAAMWSKTNSDAFNPQQLQASYNPFADGILNTLFEYTFTPADITITSEVPPTPASALQTMQPNFQNAMQPQQMQGFGAPPAQQTEEGDIEPTSDNILSLLATSGYFDEILFKPADFGEIGLRASSIESPVYNRVTVNGRVSDIPVINTGLDESFIEEYENLNDDMVNLVKKGVMIEDVYDIFNDELSIIVEGKRNYKREYRLYHGKPEQRARRSKRVLARRKMAKKHGKKAIKGKDIDHKNHNALDNSDKNLRIRSINKNRSDNGHSRKKISEGIGAGFDGSWELTLKWLSETPGQLQNIDPKLLKLLMQNKGISK